MSAITSISQQLTFKEVVHPVVHTTVNTLMA
jgi:hypothetical protein